MGLNGREGLGSMGIGVGLGLYEPNLRHREKQLLYLSLWTDSMSTIGNDGNTMRRG